jgi:hypothetical protein
MYKNENPNQAHWKEVFLQMREDKLEFFLNTQLEPTVSIPNDGFQTEWLVNSQRFQDLLVSVFYEISKGEMLKPLRFRRRTQMGFQFRENC